MKTIIAFFILLSPPLFADVAIIVHPNNTQSFDKTSINRLFLGKDKTFVNKQTALLIAQQENSIATQEFNSKVLEKNATQLKSHWSRLVFTGKGVPPNEVSSDTEVINDIKQNTNAIGYVDKASVTQDVKVVAIF